MDILDNTTDTELKEIEIDVDGVLANMDGSYAPYVRQYIPDFSEDKYIKNWDMPEVKQDYPIVFEVIKSLWTNPEFIANLPRFEGVEDGMQKLGEIVKNKAKIVIHTHIFESTEVYNCRDKWLRDLQRDTQVPFEIEISVGKRKQVRKNTFILIEDNVFNLVKSNAKYKILIRRGHNRSYDETDLGDCIKSYLCYSFNESVEVVQEILRSCGK